MKSPKKGGSQGEPDIDLAESAGSALADNQGMESQTGPSNNASSNTSRKSSTSSVKLTVEKEQSFEEEDEDLAGKVESWGVYIAGPEKTLVGLFWDKEIAEFFKDAMQGSPLLNTIGKVAQQ